MHARDGRDVLVVHALRVAQVHELVLRELRMQHEIHVAMHRAGQSRGAREVAGRAAFDRVRIELAALDHADVGFALRHEHRAVGQERDRERKRQFFGYDDDANVLAFAGRVFEGAIAPSGLFARPVGATGMPP